MVLSDFALFVLCFSLLLLSVLINNNSSLHLLLTAELLWVTLFSLALIVGLVYNNINVLALTFFFLVLSAIEFGTGLVLMLIQHSLTRSISLTDTIHNKIKFSNRFKTQAYLNRLR